MFSEKQTYNTKCNKTDVTECLWLSLFNIRDVFANSEPCKACYKQSVTFSVIQASPAAGQTQATSSPEKRGEIRISGTLFDGIVSVYLLASPAAV